MKKTKKTILGLLLSVVFVLGLVANFGHPVFGVQAEEKKTLKIWHSWTGAEEQALKDAIAKYTAKHPNVKFDLLYTPNDNFKDKLTSSIQTGDGPDLFFGAHDWVGTFATGNLILPIDSYVKDVKNQYVPSVYNIASLNGKHYGFPLSEEAVVLIYNKALVTKAPTTFTELITTAKALVKKGKKGLVVDMNNTFYNTYGFLGSYGGSVFQKDGKTPNINSQAFINYMNFMKRLVVNDKIIPKQLDYGTAQALFLEGKAGFWINGPWCFGDIQKSKIKWGAVVLPKNDMTKKNSTPFVGGKMAFLPKTCKDKALAADFAKFLTSAEIEKMFNEKVGTVPANKGVKLTKSTDKLIVQAASNGVPMPVVPEMNQVWQPVKDALTAVIDSGKPAADQAKKANQAVIAAIKEMKGE